MSCAEVMYQPYSPYFPYQRVPSSGPGMGPLAPLPTQVSSDYRHKFTSLKSHTDTSPSSLDASPTGSPPGECRPLAATASAAASRAPSGSGSTDKPEESAEAQYLSANCILFTYYSGDISSVVDEHFARALSQATSYAPTPEATVTKELLASDGPPMSHRNFPPSFWNSNYQPNGAMGGPTLGSLGPPDLSAAYGGDPYHHHPGTLHATLHHQNDPWHHYTLTGQAAGHFGHRTAHELSPYHAAASMPGPSRFAPHQYGPHPLLLQPSVRSAAVRSAAAACAASAASAGLDKADWGAARYHDPMGIAAAEAVNDGAAAAAAAYGGMGPMTGLEGQPQESKDLYWF